MDDVERLIREEVGLWRRARLMVVGDGRVGKSTLIDWLLGRSFRELESTQGTSTCNGQLTLDQSLATRWTAIDVRQQYLAHVAKQVLIQHPMSILKTSATRSNSSLGSKISALVRSFMADSGQG